jgi:nicotinamide-nucleotide adenylyltransferase
MRGLLVGRFQPFHRGHLGIVQAIRAGRPDDSLLLGIGSAQESYTWENPFTAGERFEMIARSVEEAGISQIEIVPLTDIHQHALWVRYLEGQLPPFERVYTNNALTEALFDRAGYDVVRPRLIDRTRLEGMRLRERLAAGKGWKELVPPAVARYLETIGGPARLSLLADQRGPARRSSSR